ncbi:MAG TPA: AI-2E family transporter [Candidatus Nocardiopsis merdipullorum]|nr:AI-2E family transporter [Candidatus Nocardiopsis merdipullorum]
MQAQRPRAREFLNRWITARRARAERLAKLKDEAKSPDPQSSPTESEQIQQDDVGAGDLLRMVSDVAWRMLIIGIVAGLLVFALLYLSVVTLPIVFAIFITALLMPLAQWLRSKGLGRGTSTALAILTGLVVLSGVVSMIVAPAIQGFDAIVASVTSAVTELQKLKVPFGLDPALFTNMIDSAWEQIQSMITDNQDQLVTGALTAGGAVIQILIGLVLIIALTVYFIHSGDKLMDWVATLLPPKSRPGLRHAADVSYGVMGRYVRGVAMVGLIDAVGIGAFLIFLIETNLAIPLVVLTFVGAFLPIIGAFLTGLLAVLVALVTEGLGTAVIVLVVVILVQQLESNVFAPRVYGQALELPSPVVLIAISIGGILGNVPGMFLATPVAAVLAALLRNRPMTHTNGGPEEGFQTSGRKSQEEASVTPAAPKKNEDSTGGVSD